MRDWRRFILGCTVGNVLEWYDFILYGYFAYIFAPLFFPASDIYTSRILTYGVFAAGCMMRPLGSAFFGHIGDRYGRRVSLMITIILISVATVCMGVLPTYEQVGVLAPILLALCRVVQGVAVSGEEVGAAVFLTENAPAHRQGLCGAIILSSVYVGLLLGAVATLVVVSYYSAEDILAFAWRIPFLFSGVFGAIALYIRISDIESPKFLEQKEKRALYRMPVMAVLRHHALAVLGTVSLCAVFAVSIYLFVVYMPTHFTASLHLSLHRALMYSVATLSVMSVLVLGVGLLADKYGARMLFVVGCLGFIAMAYPIFLLLSLKTFWCLVVGEAMLVAFLACLAGSIFPLLINSFPVNVCYTGVGLGFNVAMTVFGSTAPLVALSLTRYTGNVTSPFWYLLSAAVLSFIVLPFFSDKKVEPLDRFVSLTEVSV